MNLIVVTPPATELHELAFAKLQMRVDADAEDALISAYLVAAREKAEEISRRAFVTQTLALVLDSFPDEPIIKLPRPPLASVVSITYKLPDGTEESFTDFVIDTASEPGRLALADGASYPSDDLYPVGAVKITYTAGYSDDAADVPEIYKQAVLMIAADWYENREATVPNSIGSAEIVYGARALLKGDKGWY